MIEYKRGRTDETLTSKRVTWESKCGNYRVQRCDNVYEKRTIFYSYRREGDRWAIISSKKAPFSMTKKAAEKENERDSNKWAKALAKKRT